LEFDSIIVKTMKTTGEYIASLPQERREIMQKLLQTLRNNLPKGLEEGISYGMITFSVPRMD